MKSKRRVILVVSTSFPLQKHSNSGIFVERLVRALSKECELTVITPCSIVPVDKISRPYALHCFRYAPCSWQVLAHAPGGIPAAMRHNKFFLALAPGFLLALLIACIRKSKDKDLIFANWSICGLIAGLAGWLRGIPVVTTLRGEDVNLKKTSIFNYLLLNSTIALSRFTVAVSVAFSENLSQRYPKFVKHIQMIPNGIDEMLFYLDHSPPKSCINLRLVCVGSLIPRKGVDTILKALVNLVPDISLKIVGDGILRPDLEALRRTLGLEQPIVFSGALPPEEIATVLQEADALVLASYSEGRPNVVLEAMAAGLVVIASDIEGTRELVIDNQTGLLFTPGDADALRRCIERLYHSPELRQRLGENARNWIKEKGLLWENTADQYCRLFEQAIMENARR